MYISYNALVYGCLYCIFSDVADSMDYSDCNIWMFIRQVDIETVINKLFVTKFAPKNLGCAEIVG